MASSEPSRKRGREEVPSPPPAEPKEELLTPPAEPEEMPPPPPAEPEEVPLPPPEEVKRLKPPRHEVVRPFLRAPKVEYSDACFLVKMLYEAWQSLGKPAIHLGVQIPPSPKEMTVMDYTFKINVLAGNLEREVVPPSTTTATTMAASTSPALAPTLTPTPTVGLLQRRLPLLN
jgi:hypothetical protein